MSFYVWKIKVTWDGYVGRYTWGITYIPRYRQFEFNLGNKALNFWYRKDLI